MSTYGSAQIIEPHVTWTQLGHGMPKVQCDIREVLTTQQGSTKHPQKPLNQNGALK